MPSAAAFSGDVHSVHAMIVAALVIRFRLKWGRPADHRQLGRSREPRLAERLITYKPRPTVAEEAERWLKDWCIGERPAGTSPAVGNEQLWCPLAGADLTPAAIARG
jgi:hypothetical protein